MLSADDVRLSDRPLDRRLRHDNTWQPGGLSAIESGWCHDRQSRNTDVNNNIGTDECNNNVILNESVTSLAESIHSISTLAEDNAASTVYNIVPLDPVTLKEHQVDNETCDDPAELSDTSIYVDVEDPDAAIGLIEHVHPEFTDSNTPLDGNSRCDGKSNFGVSTPQTDIGATEVISVQDSGLFYSTVI